MLLQENITVHYVLLLGSAGMLTLCVGVVAFFFLYQKKLLAQKLQVTSMQANHKDELLQNTVSQIEIERERIARDLHDEVGVIFTSLSQKLGQLNKFTGNDVTNKLFTESLLLAEKGLVSTKRIAYNIIPPELETLGLVATMQNLCAQLEQPGSVTINFNADELTQEPVHNMRLALYRITQELINNTLKYANANLIVIELSNTANCFHYSYSDNGSGFVMSDLNKYSIGFRSIENRINMIKGKFIVATSPGKGFTISIDVEE